jgi:hypothetical protein
VLRVDILGWVVAAHRAHPDSISVALAVPMGLIGARALAITRVAGVGAAESPSYCLMMATEERSTGGRECFAGRTDGQAGGRQTHEKTRTALDRASE